VKITVRYSPSPRRVFLWTFPLPFPPSRRRLRIVARAPPVRYRGVYITAVTASLLARAPVAPPCCAPDVLSPRLPFANGNSFRAHSPPSAQNVVRLNAGLEHHLCCRVYSCASRLAPAQRTEVMPASPPYRRSSHLCQTLPAPRRVPTSEPNIFTT